MDTILKRGRMILNEKAEIFDGAKKVYTHLVIAAHQDDVEIMCGDGIAQCYNDENKGLVAVIVSDGAGSPRNGKFANFTNEQMSKQRRLEQKEAAKEGNYATLIMLNYPSKEIATTNAKLIEDLCKIIKKYNPHILYTHNPADKHKTHIKVLQSALYAIRKLPNKNRPRKMYGCECWRDLDWLNDKDKVVFNLTGYDDLLTRLLSMHISQIEGGKRYDLAAQGRRLANATFFRSHNVDVHKSASFAMDLTPLIEDDNLDLKEYTFSKIDNFKADILLD